MRFLFASPVPDSARDVSETFGVRVNLDMVFDLRSNEAISVPGEVFSYFVPYPFWLRALPAAQHAITRNLNSLFLPWASSLDTLATLGGRSFTPLFTTSEAAGVQRGTFEIRPDVEPYFDPANLSTQLLAVAVDGAVGAVQVPVPPPEPEPADSVGADTTAMPFDAGTNGGGAAQLQEPQQEPEQEPADTTPRVLGREVQQGPPTGRVVVVGDADFLTDAFVRNASENVIFALNAIDWLTQSDALLSIRSKQRTPRPLVFESDATRQAIKYLNLIGVPLVFVLFGAVRLMQRRAMTRRTYGQ
jgi:ABC-type uncharacterized transport system involved in gliding motility auxiliary subunit